MLQTHALLIRLSHALLKDWLRLNRLELGLEVFEGLGLRGRIGAAASIGHVYAFDVFDLVAGVAPMTVECG